MEHKNLEKESNSALMLPKEGGDEKYVIMLPHSHKSVGKILIKEGCKNALLTCSRVRNRWSVLCWQISDKKYYTSLFLLSATFVLCLIAPVFLLSQSYRNTDNNAPLSDMVLRNNSLAYSVWQKPMVQPLIKVHLFNYTNWRRYQDGFDAKLHVEDVGPYVYSQQLENENVQFERDTITFQERNIFKFLPDKSVGSHFDKISVPNIILLDMVLRNNSLAYSVWQKPMVQPLIKVHLFNYTNWRRYQDGFDAKLHVEDVGPYVYSQQLENENVQFERDTITFQERNIFKFLPDKSVGSHFDKISVPNIILLAVSQTLSKMLNQSYQKQLVLTALSFAYNRTAFIQLPVHRFLWGYEDDIFNTIKPFLSLQTGRTYDQFGLLAENNNTLAAKVTINTGKIDIDKLNVIEEIDGESHLNVWSTSHCNSIIEATDGTLFPPSQLDRRTPLLVFFKALCRRLPFVYEKDIEVDGIPLIRYRLSEDVFDDPHHNAENQCYCDVDSGNCPPQGIVNTTACTTGTPFLVSLPHFYGGDPRLRDNITGLKPDLKMHHDNYLDVHPTLGMVLTRKNSLQINMQVIKTDGLNSLSFLDQDMILPIAWIETTVEEVPESLHNLIYNGKISTSSLQLGLAATSMTMLLISGICVLVLLIGRRQKPCATMNIRNHFS